MIDGIIGVEWIKAKNRGVPGRLLGRCDQSEGYRLHHADVNAVNTYGSIRPHDTRSPSGPLDTDSRADPPRPATPRVNPHRTAMPFAPDGSSRKGRGKSIYHNDTSKKTVPTEGERYRHGDLLLCTRCEKSGRDDQKLPMDANHGADKCTGDWVPLNDTTPVTRRAAIDTLRARSPGHPAVD